ncbi:4'-phosphopantetheinyl transferase family protein [Nakamurella sp.]|uniref:4'-phosphopantetheinyl transferase family protein n=1 Tax=Nakamurella sp. TaxID=1869182 RepID=UPI003B3B40BD
MREIHVWTVHLAGLPTGGDLLDDDERSRWQRLRSAGLRERFAAAHWARRRILADRLGVDPAGLRFTTGRWGKPELAGHPVFHSLSHSGAVAMVAVSDAAPVGVDVEAVRPDLPAGRLARTFFRPDEAGSVAAAVDPPARYVRLWTRKEAAGKVTGVALDRALLVDAIGVGGRPAGIEDPTGARGAARIIDIEAPEGFLAAVAMLGGAPVTVRARALLLPVPA